MNIDKYTPTELTKLSNDLMGEHEKIKEEMINCLNIIEENKEKINKLNETLTIVEKIFVDINNHINKIK